MEEIRQVLAKGQQTDVRHLQQLLDRYFADLRSFAAARESKILEAIGKVGQDAKDALETERRNSDKLDMILARLPKPAEVHTEIEQELQERKEEAEREYNQGYELVQKYQFREAISHLRKALDAVPLPAFYLTLSTALWQLPDLVEAERVAREGLNHFNGGKAGQEASLDNQLDVILKDQGDLAGALEYSRRALQIGEKVYGPDHPTVATLANNIGQILQDQGDLAGALEYSCFWQAGLAHFGGLFWPTLGR